MNYTAVYNPRDMINKHTARQIFSLTPREIEIVNLVAQGCSNKQIAAKLFISEETVKKHLKNIFCKLNVANRVSAAMKLR
jgi:DNA-binding NarL/FixJ family response regulator